MNDKLYGIIEGIVTNEGEGTGNLAVCAMLSPSESFPRARIVLGSNKFSNSRIDGFAISVSKWRELEALVNLACVDITSACPAHGDRRLAAPTNDGMTRPQKLRAYLVSRYRELELRVKLQSGMSHLADEAELVGTLVQWMDEAGLGR